MAAADRAPYRPRIASGRRRCNPTKPRMRSRCSTPSIRSIAPASPKRSAKEIAKQGRRPPLFVEINTGAESQKAGVLPQDADSFSRGLPRPLRHPRFPVLMCIPPHRRSSGAAFRADRQDRAAQRAETPFDGHERRFCHRDRLRCHPCPGRHCDFRWSRAHRLSMNHVFSSLATMRRRSCRKSRRAQRDTACGRAETLPGNVDEYRAAAAGDAGPGIVVDLDDQVVEPVVTAEPVAWFIGRAPERPVIAPIRRVLAPGVVRRDRRTGSKVRGRGRRSARHHSRTG